MRIGEIINALEEWAPPVLQESYDNSGLIVGALDWETSGVLVALDCLESVVDEAIEKKVQCIIAHHPIVFSGLKRFNGRTYVERVIMKAIKESAMAQNRAMMVNIQQYVNSYQVPASSGENNATAVQQTEVNIGLPEPVSSEPEVDTSGLVKRF